MICEREFFEDVKVIFDVGANIGQTAIKFNRSFKDADIYSFEPVRQSFNQLSDNTSSLNKVKCFQLALGDKVKTVEIDVYQGDTSVLNSLKKGFTKQKSKPKIEN